jgi:hypothetical protein
MTDIPPYGRRFLLDPQYAGFEMQKLPLKRETIFGRVKRPPNALIIEGILALLYGILMFAVVGILFGDLLQNVRLWLSGDDTQVTLTTLSPLILCLVFSFWGGRMAWRGICDLRRFISTQALYRRYLRESKLITGEIVSCEKRYEDSRNVVYVTLQFTAPNQNVLTGTQSKEREDSLVNPLPPPGTPVTVVYVDDQNYVIL